MKSNFYSSILILSLFIFQLLYAVDSESVISPEFLSPISVFKINDQVYFSLPSMTASQLFRGFKSFRKKLQKKYSKDPISVKLNDALNDLEEGKFFLLPVDELAGSDKKAFTFGVNPKSQGFKGLLPAGSFVLAKEAVHFFSQDELRATLLYLSLQPYLNSFELEQFFEKLYPDILRKYPNFPTFRVLSTLLDNRTKLLLQARKEAFEEPVITSNNEEQLLPLEKQMIYALNREKLHPRSITEIRNKLKSAIAVEKVSDSHPMIQAMINILLDDEYQNEVTDKTVANLLDLISQEDMPEKTIRYIAAYLQALHYLDDNLITEKQERLIRFFFDVLTRQVRFVSTQRFINIRAAIAWWAYGPKGLSDIKKQAKAALSRIDQAGAEKLLRYADKFTPSKLRGKINERISEADIRSYYDVYEYRNDVDFEFYRGNFLNTKKNAIEALLDDNKQILLQSIWLLFNGKTISGSDIERIDISFIGEGGVKLAFLAEIVLKNGELLPVVLKGIKYPEVVSKRGQLETLKLIQEEETERHKYYSRKENSSIFGFTTVQDDTRVSTEEYFPDTRVDDFLKGKAGRTTSRLDEYLKPSGLERANVKARQQKWREAGIVALKGIMDIIFQDGEFLDDPKPANILIEKKTLRRGTTTQAFFYDYGSVEKIESFSQLHRYIDEILANIAGPNDYAYKGIEELYPELMFESNCSTVGYTEVAIVLHKIFRGHAPSLKKLFSDDSNVAIKIINHFNARYRGISSVEELTVLKEIFDCFPDFVLQSNKFKEAFANLFNREKELLNKQLMETYQPQKNKKVIDSAS